ncbi:DUF1080 domain-containing protein [Roseiconus nitratireducens]|uniref:DUF1080 domain-containing protein n=1 Tax=Roseiconus nitratireducens TaxID=2605748 RepID=A0A5M6DDG2_9BACT|nr:DUF1080 domain-containing protein [Roseiconus nitratireducens]KAA5544506.1 DUF1080 domain-containing protein [Roseiconus nitratireducens]
MLPADSVRTSPKRLLVLTSILVAALSSGCRRGAPSVEPAESVSQSRVQEDAAEAQADSPATFAAQTYEATAEQLLAARLPDDEASEGWVRLFDGHTLYGWEISGKADFRVDDGAIVVDQGAVCLMCTSTTWGDFDLTLEFEADDTTNSGIFIRTPLEPQDPASDCYEINIAPDDNPFPTGSIVARKKADYPDGRPDPPTDGWRTMRIVARGGDISVEVDGKPACNFSDPMPLAPRRIGLQHNSGRVAFRNLKIKPLGLDNLLDADLSQWKKYPEMPGDFTVNEQGELHVVGGRTQLETRSTYGDFYLLAEYKIDDPAMNSGIFFRCIPGDEMMGYECQVHNGYKNDSRLSPQDCGTGGIFRRQDARVVAGETGQWSTLLLHANGDKMAAWVGGVQVSDWQDTRPPDENPRKGKRLAPGTIMIQGHDPGTDVLFRNLQIVDLDAE